MKIIVVGLGSMGKRRIRLIKQLYSNVLIYGVDSRAERRKEAKDLYNVISFDNIEDAFKEKCDFAFICTSPLSHAELISKCLDENLHVFTEINLVSNKYEENIKKARERGLTLFLSSTFCYREEIKYIINAVGTSKSLPTYVYHVGQYLPDWHPWENYSDYFIGEKQTNGCREIMAIEFPWIFKAFGKITNVSVRRGKKSNLKINYNDSYLISLEHKSGIQGMIAIDVVSRKPVRNLEVFSEDLYLTWDGTANGLKGYDFTLKKEKPIKLYDEIDKQDNYASFIVENAYKNEIETFFNIVNSSNTTTESVYGFEEDLEILKLIDKIEG